MNLENRFFYRLVKVFYVFFIFLASMIAAATLYFCYPESIPDNNRSYIISDSGRLYYLSNLGIKLNPNDTNLDGIIINDKNTDEVIKDAFFAFPKTDKNIRLKIIYEPKNWVKYLDILFWSIICLLAFYIIINIIRETLIYLAFGKKFTWDWFFSCKQKLDKEIDILNSNHEPSK